MRAHESAGGHEQFSAMVMRACAGAALRTWNSTALRRLLSLTATSSCSSPVGHSGARRPMARAARAVASPSERDGAHRVLLSGGLEHGVARLGRSESAGPSSGTAQRGSTYLLQRHGRPLEAASGASARVGCRHGRRELRRRRCHRCEAPRHDSVTRDGAAKPADGAAESRRENMPRRQLPALDRGCDAAEPSARALGQNNAPSTLSSRTPVAGSAIVPLII
jgi:hypothetical protein